MNKAQKVFINLFGPIYSGKTTVAKILHKKMPRTIMISNDKLKWFVSDYKEEDRPTISSMVFDIVKRAFENGFDVIRDQNLFKETPKQIEMYKNLFKEKNIKCFEFDLEASLPTLLNRHTERVERAKTDGTQLMTKTKDSYMKHYEQYTASRRPMKVFNTEVLTPDEIAEQILIEIKNA